MSIDDSSAAIMYLSKLLIDKVLCRCAIYFPYVYFTCAACFYCTYIEDK